MPCALSFVAIQVSAWVAGSVTDYHFPSQTPCHDLRRWVKGGFIDCAVESVVAVIVAANAEGRAGTGVVSIVPIESAGPCHRVVGELAVLDPQPRTATVVARTPALLFRLRKPA